MWVWGVTVVWGAVGWSLYIFMAKRCQGLRRHERPAIERVSGGIARAYALEAGDPSWIYVTRWPKDEA